MLCSHWQKRELIFQGTSFEEGTSTWANEIHPFLFKLKWSFFFMTLDAVTKVHLQCLRT